MMFREHDPDIIRPGELEMTDRPRFKPLPFDDAMMAAQLDQVTMAALNESMRLLRQLQGNTATVTDLITLSTFILGPRTRPPVFPTPPMPQWVNPPAPGQQPQMAGFPQVGKWSPRIEDVELPGDEDTSSLDDEIPDDEIPDGVTDEEWDRRAEAALRVSKEANPS
jgi:hypothetical protein